MGTQRAFLFDGIKAAAAPWDFDSLEGWTVIGEQPSTSVDTYFKRVPWLYRGVMDRASNVGAMPFTITRGEKEIDNSQDYQNKLGFLAEPGKLFELIEQANVMTGRAWLYLIRNRSGYVKDIKYCSPYSIEERRDQQTGELIGYTRTIGANGRKVDIPKEDIIGIFDNEYMTEDGPPQSSAAGAALTASGVLYNADRFISQYFARGAIKATVLTMDGGSQGEAERLQSWWSDVVAGIKNAWSAVVLRMSQIKATVIGEGLESLSNTDMSTERRQDIATALGIPESRLWSSAANYATRGEDEKAYYTSTIIPECRAIANTLNSKLFTAENKLEGYKIKFNFDSLDMFQEDVKDQVTAAKGFVDFLTACPTAEIAKETALLIGFELTDTMLIAIDAWFSDKQAQAEQMQAQMQPAQQPVEDEPAQAEEQPDPDNTPNQQEVRAALSAWKRKAIKAVKAGESADVEFETTIIPAWMQDAIHFELADCQDADGVKAAFIAVQPPDVETELKRANDLLERFADVQA